MTLVRNSPASDAVKRRSAARSSVSCPRLRSRARGNGGSERVAITRCSRSGRWSRRKATASCTSGAPTAW